VLCCLPAGHVAMLGSNIAIGCCMQGLLLLQKILISSHGFAVHSSHALPVPKVSRKLLDPGLIAHGHAHLVPNAVPVSDVIHDLHLDHDVRLPHSNVWVGPHGYHREDPSSHDTGVTSSHSDGDHESPSSRHSRDSHSFQGATIPPRVLRETPDGENDAQGHHLVGHGSPPLEFIRHADDATVASGDIQDDHPFLHMPHPNPQIIRSNPNPPSHAAGAAGVAARDALQSGGMTRNRILRVENSRSAHGIGTSNGRGSSARRQGHGGVVDDIVEVVQVVHPERHVDDALGLHRDSGPGVREEHEMHVEHAGENGVMEDGVAGELDDGDDEDEDSGDGVDEFDDPETQESGVQSHASSVEHSAEDSGERGGGGRGEMRPRNLRQGMAKKTARDEESTDGRGAVGWTDGASGGLEPGNIHAWVDKLKIVHKT
jgi:hypothetical protein